MAAANIHALFSYLAYRPGVANLVELPSGWAEREDLRQPSGSAEDPSGYKAYVFTNGSEYIVAFRGSAPFKWTEPDWITNRRAALGSESSQIQLALEMVANLQAAGVPLSQVSFTGHSLGGGLASVVATFFDRSATTFALAPFERSADDEDIVSLYYDYYVSYLAGKSQTLQPDSAFTGYRNVWAVGGTPGRALLNIREANVTDEREKLSAVHAVRRTGFDTL
jgi:hypothetical protein